MSLRACILVLGLMAATVVADAEVVDSTTLSCTIVQSDKVNGTNPSHRGHENKNQNQDATKLGKALYFMTNSDENGIVSLRIQDDGKVTGGSTTRTQEKGIVSIDGSTKKPAERDGLVSQSSVHVVDNVSLSTLSHFVPCKNHSLTACSTCSLSTPAPTTS